MSLIPYTEGQKCVRTTVTEKKKTDASGVFKLHGLQFRVWRSGRAGTLAEGLREELRVRRTSEFVTTVQKQQGNVTHTHTRTRTRTREHEHANTHTRTRTREHEHANTSQLIRVHVGRKSEKGKRSTDLSGLKVELKAHADIFRPDTQKCTEEEKPRKKNSETLQ